MEERLREYLDGMILHWEIRRFEAKDSDTHDQALSNAAIYQSIRVAMFGEPKLISTDANGDPRMGSKSADSND